MAPYSAGSNSFKHSTLARLGEFAAEKWRCQVEGKAEGQGEGGWIWQEKTWKELELRMETKSIRRSGKYFRAVATPHREKPKEEEEDGENFGRVVCQNEILSDLKQMLLLVMLMKMLLLRRLVLYQEVWA